jgi:hypothetical protein
LVTFGISPLFAQSETRPVPLKVRQLYESGANFSTFSPFEASERPNTAALEVVKTAQFLDFDAQKIADILYKRPAQLSLQIPYNGTLLQVDVYRENILANDFRVLTRDDETTFYTPGVHYQGILSDDFQSLVSLSFFEGEVMGFISNETLGNLVLGRLEGNSDENDYILYADRDLRPLQNFSCTERGTGKKKDPVPQGPATENANINGCVEIFLEADYTLYTTKGSSVSNTVNYVTGLFAQVATLYNNESISIKISRLYVWTTPDSYSTSSSGDALDQFQALRDNFDGDLAHLISLSGTNLGGVAYLDALCDVTWGYGYSGIDPTYNNVPTYSWTINVVAHELGHNFGSEHTHACVWNGNNTAIDGCGPTAGYSEGCNAALPASGTIMSYCHLVSGVGVNLANGFGPQPRAVIQAGTTAAYNSGCLPQVCPVISCASPSNISVGSITTTSATITWGAVAGATAYNIHYRPTGTAAWITISNATSPQLISGLSVNTLYDLEMQSVCGGPASEYTYGVIFKTLDSPCTAPTSVSTSGATASTVSVSWSNTNSPPPTNFSIQYGPVGFTLGTGTTVTATSSPATLTGLIGGMIYDCYVRANCAGGLGTSAWSSAATFQTTLANDVIGSAIDLTVGAPCVGTNPFRNNTATATGEFSPTSGNGGYWASSANNTVWFKFTAPGSGTVRVNTNTSPGGTLSDTQVALYGGAAATAANYLASNEDGLDANDPFRAEMVYSGLTPGSTCYIQVDGYNNQTGTFCIAVTEDIEITTPGASCTNYPTSAVGTSAANTGKWVNLYNKPDGFNIGRPVAAVKSSVNLGNVTVSALKSTSIQQTGNGVKYMQRYYNFAASTNTAGARDVRLFFTDTELDFLKSVTSTAYTAADLNISHYDGSNENCTPNDNAASSVLISNVADTYIGSTGVFFLDFQVNSFSEMGAHFGLAPLPVELTRFDVQILEKSNWLQWEAAAETRFEQYGIERSTDGASNWATLGKRQPNASKQYEFEDANPLPSAYYRLKMLDRDGSFTHSNVLFAKRELDRGILHRVYPNPAMDLLWIEYSLLEEADAVIQIWHSDGRLVFELTQASPNGTNLIPLQIADLPVGTYHIAVRTAQESLGHTKFVKY